VLVGARIPKIDLAQSLQILLLKTQVRLAPLLPQPLFPLLRKTVKLWPLVVILVQTLLVNALLLLFLFLLPSLRHLRLLSRLILTLLLPINLLLPLCL
jgi:hypothetical protein